MRVLAIGMTLVIISGGIGPLGRDNDVTLDGSDGHLHEQSTRSHVSGNCSVRASGHSWRTD